MYLRNLVQEKKSCNAFKMKYTLKAVSEFGLNLSYYICNQGMIFPVTDRKLLHCDLGAGSDQEISWEGEQNSYS